jgi:hypothetical protein
MANTLKVLRKLRPKISFHDDFFVFDVETWLEKKNGKFKYGLAQHPDNFMFACLYGRNVNKVFYSVDAIKLEFKKPEYKNKKIFAHNATYDLTTVYGNIFTGLDNCAIFNGSRFICATNGNCIFADSLNIYQSSVEEIGKMLGIFKQDLQLNRWHKEITEKAINYCFNDCRIIWEALISIFSDAGDIKITQASLSLTYFRRYFQQYDIYHNENTSFFWDSYYGGRTEIFQMGKTHSFVIDVNSMYPYAMKFCNFPNPQFLRVDKNVSVNKFLNQILKLYEGCCYCTIRHKDLPYGYLPTRKDGKLIFPIGVFSGCWNFNELLNALKHNAIEILNIERIVYAEKMHSPFVDYVDTLYLKRIGSKNELEKFRIKIFMNSLYGKFGQRIEEETIYIDNVQNSIDLIRDYQRKNSLIKVIPFNEDRNDCFLVVSSDKNISLNYSIPSFSSYITSFARIMLINKLYEVRDLNPVYCDTDSIFLESLKGVKSDKHLGGWKIEEKIVTEILGLKNYKYVDKGIFKHRIKGIPKTAVKNGDLFEYYNLIKTKEALRRQIFHGKKVKRTKKLKSTYKKRIVNADNTTKPLVLC